MSKELLPRGHRLIRRQLISAVMRNPRLRLLSGQTSMAVRAKCGQDFVHGLSIGRYRIALEGVRAHFSESLKLNDTHYYIFRARHNVARLSAADAVSQVAAIDSERLPMAPFPYERM